MPPINLHIPLDVHIHQHEGDRRERCEISVGNSPVEMVNANAVAGRIRQLVNDQIKNWELPRG